MAYDIPWTLNALATGNPYAGGSPQAQWAYEYAKQMGYGGDPYSFNPDPEAHEAPGLSQDFINYARDNGYTFGSRALNRNDVETGLFQNGNLLGSNVHRNTLRDTGFNRAVDKYLPVALAAMGGYAALQPAGLGANSGWLGAGSVDGMAGAAAGGFTPAEAAAAYGGGAGMAGVQPGMFPGMAVGPVGENAGAGVLEGLGDNLGQLGAVGAPAGGVGTALSAGATGGGSWLSSLFPSLSGTPLGNISNGQLLNLGGNLVSGFLGANASRRAANAQLDASREANALTRSIYDQQRADFAPYREAGVSALSQIQNLLRNPNAITEQPDYKFGLDQGTRALNSGAAARGMTYSGAQGKALTRFGQDYAGTKLNDSYNRLASIAGIGQQATGATSNAAGNYGAQVGNNLIGMGNAQGSSYVGGANAWGGAIGNALQNYQQQPMLDAWLKRYGGGG